MGQLSGAVVVLPSEGCTFEAACSALIPILQPGVANPTWEVKSRSQDDRRILVDPESTEFFSMLTWTNNPKGLSWVKLGLDRNALFRDESSVLAILESYFWTALMKLTALYGYLTSFEHQFEDDWLESNVLAPLLLQRYRDLDCSSYHLLLLSKSIRDGIEPNANWTLVKESPEGVLFRRRTS